MFFDDPSLIPKIAGESGFAIFILRSDLIDLLHTSKKPIKTARSFSFPTTTFYLEPDEKHSIKVNQIRELEAIMATKQLEPRFFVIKHAETMNEAAENAALKLLEEPRENCHLVFLATNLENFLPTILSRAKIYIQKIENPLDAPVLANENILEDARLLLSSSSHNILILVKKWTDKKSKKTLKSRLEILQILGSAIEIAYKSYFKTKNPAFLKKIPALITTYENIQGNGHIKLQLIAHLC